MSTFRSKRFWAAASAIAAFIGLHQYPEALAALLTYLGVETVRPSRGQK